MPPPPPLDNDGAARHPLQTSDLLHAVLLCDACPHQEDVRRSVRHQWTAVHTLEHHLLAFLQQRREPCPACGAPRSAPTGHITLATHSPGLDAWLLLRLDLTPSPKRNDTRVTRELSLHSGAPDKPAEVIDESDIRLPTVWRDLLLRACIDRAALEGRAENAVRHILPIARQQPDDPFPPLAIGMVMTHAGEDRHARIAFDRTLALRPDNAVALVGAGLAARALGELDAAASRLSRAWDLTGDDDLIEPTLHAAFQSRRHALLARFAEVVTEKRPDHVEAHRALALLGDSTDPDEARLRWRNLHRVALAAGKRRIAAVADHALACHSLPLPPWTSTSHPLRWTAEAAETLAECGHEVDRSPRPVLTDAAGQEVALPVDLEVTTRDGRHLLLFLFPGRMSEHRLHGLDTLLSAIGDDPRSEAGVFPLVQSRLPFTTWLRCAPGAEQQLLMRAERETDVTLTVREDTLSAFLRDVEHVFGVELDLTVDHLDVMDELLVRWHEGGFARPLLGLQARIAVWYGTLLDALVPDGKWGPPATEDSAPMIYHARDGSSLDLVSLAGAGILNGPAHGPGPAVRELLVRLTGADPA